MKLGIVGLAGCGKSTLFEALTRAAGGESQHGNQRLGTVKVPEARIDWLSRLYQPRKTTFAQVEYLLPGLASGGRERKTEGPAWSQTRDCDALIHVVRNFGLPGGAPPRPRADFLNLDQEFILADLGVVEKRQERLAADRQRGRKIDSEEAAVLDLCRQALEGELPLRRRPELVRAPSLRGFGLFSAKPVLVLVNNGEDDPELPELGGLALQERCLAVRGKLEHELAQMDADEAAAFLAEYGIAVSAMDRVIQSSYELLGLMAFFTVGEDEVKAWTIRRGTPALEAAGEIHSDIKKGFIRAEVVACADLKAAGSYAEARKRGTVRLEGKTYSVQDGDIINFRFNV
jgi:hypothetical protein